MNPCPCGYLGSNTHYCTCSKKQIITYQNRLSGPLRDRFDINLCLKPIDFNAAVNAKGEVCSKIVRERVEEARNRQFDRYGREICNGRIPYEVLLSKSPLTDAQQSTLHQLAIKRNWSNRTQIKIIRLARTISDLQASQTITDQSIWDAVKLNEV
jgi:magnesium chelatase family protein